MKTPNQNSTRGFTLVESMIAVSLLAILFLAVAQTSSRASDAFDEGSAEHALSVGTHRCLERMSQAIEFAERARVTARLAVRAAELVAQQPARADQAACHHPRQIDGPRQAVHLGLAGVAAVLGRLGAVRLGLRTVLGSQLTTVVSHRLSVVLRRAAGASHLLVLDRLRGGSRRIALTAATTSSGFASA